MTPENERCRRTSEWVEELTPATMGKAPVDEQIAEHLRTCASCGSTYERAVKLCRAMQEWKEPPLQVNMQAKVMAAIAQKESEKARLRTPPGFGEIIRSLFGRRVQVPAYAIAAMVCVLLVSATWNVISWSAGKTSEKSAGTLSVADSHVEQSPLQPASPKLDPIIVQALNTPRSRDLIQEASAVRVSRTAHTDTVVPVIVMILGAPPAVNRPTIEQSSLEDHVF